jgi:hypothetical protein
LSGGSRHLNLRIIKGPTSPGLRQATVSPAHTRGSPAGLPQASPPLLSVTIQYRVFDPDNEATLRVSTVSPVAFNHLGVVFADHTLHHTKSLIPTRAIIPFTLTLGYCVIQLSLDFLIFSMLLVL